ncbi:MAG UNVERIFIED_CONTAM: arylsulfatase [Planctomycetaceae bacterium]|jgi:arylsulfatase A-like enzyme
MDRLTHFRPSLPLPLLLALFLTSAATVIAGPSDDDKEQSPRPLNVVFILADDLGFQELGCFGQQKIRTPHLDQLAAHGMKLTQHYSGNAVCAPSRCVLMTGKHPGHAWIRNNSEAQPEGQRPIPASEVTLAEVLKARGYVTGAFGKWGLGGPGTEGDPVRQGFDQFFGYNCQRHAHSYYPDYLWKNTERVPLNNKPPVPGHAKLAPDADPRNPASYAPFQGADYAPDRIREAALEFIRNNQQQPFFLYYPSTLPHVALHIPDADLKPYHELGWDDPPFTASKGGYTPHFTPRAAYAAMISRLDSDVGAITAELDRLGLKDQTLIVFSADNGTTHLQEEVDVPFFNSVGSLRGLKGSLYEGGVRVPTIVKLPGVVPKGSASDFVSGFEDWLPTIAELCGISRDQLPAIDGISLSPTLRGQNQKPRAYLYREFPGYGGQQSIRQGDWKLVRQQLSKNQLTPELYNLREDPNETTDIAKLHPEIVEQLSLLITQERTPSKLFPLKPLDNSSAF